MDTNNEWFHDKSNEVLYLFPDDGLDPSSRSIKAKTTDYIVTFNNSNYISFKKINFFATTIDFVKSKVEAGSGSLPTQNIESYAISIDSNISAAKLSKLFRSATTPLIGYIHKSIFFIDLKAIPNDQVNLVSNMIIEILS